MRNHLLSIPLLAVVTILTNVNAIFAEAVTLDSLLDEMVNRSTLADFPAPAYTCKQASSYDRHSLAPDKPDWFANDDRSYFVRSEKNGQREEWVMMDAKGPGAITRWWVTSGAYTGTIRVYIDGDTTPVIEAKVDDLVGGQTLVGAPLATFDITASGTVKGLFLVGGGAGGHFLCRLYNNFYEVALAARSTMRTYRKKEGNCIAASLTFWISIKSLRLKQALCQFTR